MKTLIKTYMSNSEKETIEFAKNFAKDFTGGEVIAFNGDLGAGKTIFAKGVAKAFNISCVINSPTFTILNVYNGDKLNLYHFDMYRIDDEDELHELGFWEYIGKQDGVCLIEWYEKTLSLMPTKFYVITIQKIDENTRKFIIEMENKNE